MECLRWGPSMHTGFAFAEGHAESPATIKIRTLRAALEFVLTQRPHSDTSNDIFSIHSTASRGVMKVMIATEYILHTILQQVTRLDAIRQFFNMMRGDPCLESSPRTCYEKLSQLQLTPDHGTAEPFVFRSSVIDPPITLPVIPNVIPLLSSLDFNDANQNNPPFYWRPVSQDFMSFDAIICTLDTIFLQFFWDE